MEHEVVENRPGCIAFAAKVVGDKWTPLLVQCLAEQPCRFGELQERLGINPRTLTARLDRLYAVGIIERAERTNDQPHAAYQLTAQGRDLIAVLRAMAEWGEKYRGGAWPPVGRP